MIALLILSLLLIGVILIQQPKGESLATAFNGGFIHITKAEKQLSTIILVLFLSIIATIFILK